MSKQSIQFDSLYELPANWKWTPLENLMAEPTQDVVDGPFGSNLKASEYTDDGVIVARLQNVSRNEFLFKNIRFISSQKAKSLSRHNFNAGDILLTKLGNPLGKACIVPDNISQGIIVADLVRIRLRNNAIDSKYLCFAINSPFIAKQFERHTKGTTRPRVNLGIIRKLPIPLAPRKTQDQIVAEIEKQFSRLDEAVTSLKRAKANLKRYKAAVLKAAVEGKLTEEWRKQHPDVEPATELLKRILAERRRKWEEAELAKMRAKDKEPRDDRWRDKYREAARPDLNELPKPISSWAWSTFDEVSKRVTVGHVGPMKNEYVKDGIPFLRSQNVRENRYVSIGLNYISPKFHHKVSKSALDPGDIVVVRSGNVGVTCVIPQELPTANCSDLVIVKQPKGILPEYGAYYMNSVASTRVAAKRVGVALTHFNTKSMASMPIPVPPLLEQEVIIDEVGKRLSIIEAIDIEANTSLVRAERLRQSILKRAFSGELLAKL